MRSKRSLSRGVLSALLALVFFVAAMPGSMAVAHMAKPASPVMTMTCCGDAQMSPSPCDHMKVHQDQDQGKPCKNMAQCLGMLNCFGMGAVALAMPVVMMPSRDAPIAFAHQRVAGFDLQPDNPPPIV
jgi:hypothetical protein